MTIEPVAKQRGLELGRIMPSSSSAKESKAPGEDSIASTTPWYLHSLVRAAAVDSVITEAEREDLESVCDLLGLDRSALDSALRDVHAAAESALSNALAQSVAASASPSTKPSPSKPDRPTRNRSR